MKRFICWLLGHQWRPYHGDFFEPYCIRCGKHPTFAQILKDAARR